MKSYSYLYSDYGQIDIGSYSSLHGQSQPYQSLYSVYAKMVKLDIKIGVYKPDKGGYTLNPTAEKLDDRFDGKLIRPSRGDLIFTYVIDKDGDVIIGKRNGNGRRSTGALPTPHPTLVGGLNPKVRMAGILHIKDGKIVSYDNQSGHYRPNIKSMKIADEAFKKYPMWPKNKEK